MSTTDAPTDAEEKRVTKKVDIVCYLNTEDGETRRQFAQRVSGSTDYFKKSSRTTVNNSYFLEAGPVSVELDEEEYEGLSNYDMGDATLRHNVEEDERVSFDNRPKKPLKDMVREMFVELSDEWLDDVPDWEREFWGVRMSKTEDDGTIHCRTNFERMKMLKHQSEITPDDMFVDEDEDYLAFKLNLKIRDVTEDELEFFDENLVSPLMTRLARHEWVDRVRTYDCEMQTQEKGVCFNI